MGRRGADLADQPCSFLHEAVQRCSELNATVSVQNIYHVHHLCSACHCLLISTEHSAAWGWREHHFTVIWSWTAVLSEWDFDLMMVLEEKVRGMPELLVWCRVQGDRSAHPGGAETFYVTSAETKVKDQTFKIILWGWVTILIFCTMMINSNILISTASSDIKLLINTTKQHLNDSLAACGASHYCCSIMNRRKKGRGKINISKKKKKLLKINKKMKC